MTWGAVRCGPTRRQRVAYADRQGCHVARRSTAVAGTRDNGRSDAPVAVGVQEPREAGGRPACHGAPDRPSSIPKLLALLHYRRQVNRKTLEGSRNPFIVGQSASWRLSAAPCLYSLTEPYLSRRIQYADGTRQRL
jgi:hypothetical protein